MRFKKIIILVSLFVLIETSHAESTYANIGVGLLDTKKIDNVGIGPMFRLGYLFNEASNSFGLEAEANPMVVKIDNNNNNSYHSNRDMAITLASYFVYNLHIPDTQFTVRPQAGVVFPNLGDNLYEDSSSFGYGLSVIYKIKEELGIYASYGSFDSSVNHYSLGLEVSF